MYSCMTGPYRVPRYLHNSVNSFVQYSLLFRLIVLLQYYYYTCMLRVTGGYVRIILRVNSNTDKLHSRAAGARDAQLAVPV